ncbi:MAG: LysR family transcriptional regulator [Aristaeellaceae bacterium]
MIGCDAVNLDRLHEFVVLAEQGSFSGAAGALGLAPATLSARFHAFEESLDARLLAAGPKGLEPTDAGRILLTHARSILGAYQATAAAVAAIPRHAYRRLRIALAETSLPMFLGPFLDRINQNWPDVHIDLVNGSRLPMAESLLRGSVDLYCTLLMDDAVPEGLTRMNIAQPFHHVLLPREHRLAQRTSVSIRELDGECFILAPNSEEPCVRSFQLTNLAAAGIRYRTYDSETDAVYTALLVSIGKGVLLMPSPSPNLPPHAVALSLRDLPHPATPCILASRQSPNPDVHEFMANFAAFIREASRRNAEVKGGGAP